MQEFYNKLFSLYNYISSNNFIENELNYFKETNNENIILIILLISLILFIFKLLKNHFLIFSFFTFFSTLFHESAHFLISFFLNGKPFSMSLLPRKTDSGYVLGFVESKNITWYNGGLIGLAPLLLIPLAYIFLRNDVIFEKDILILSLKIFFISSLLEGSIPSSTDLILALKKSIIILFFIGLFIYLKFHQYIVQ